MTPRRKLGTSEVAAEVVAAEVRARLDAFERTLRRCRCPAPVPSRCYLGEWLCALCQRLIQNTKVEA
jgi:hypothetical protein